MFVLAGCGKNQHEADLQKPFALPGASKVIEALDKKDYEATVAGLFAVKSSLTEKDKPEYRRLRERVLEKIVPVMGESEPAKEAYRAIAMMETGR